MLNKFHEGPLDSKDAPASTREALTETNRKHLLSVANLSATLTAEKKGIVRDRKGNVSIAWAAKRAGIPLSSAHLEPISSAIRDLAKEHQFESTEEPQSGDAADLDGPVGPVRVTRPELNHGDTERWLALACKKNKDINVEDLLDAFEGIECLDMMLDASKEGVPGAAGRPVKTSVAKRIGVHVAVLDHPAIEAMIMDLARKHGLVSHKGPPRARRDRTLRSLVRVTDRMHTLRLRGEVFDADEHGICDIAGLIDTMGLDPALIYSRRFRNHVLDCHRRCNEGAGLPLPPSGEELDLGVCNAVLDCYEHDIDAGTVKPPLTVMGKLRMERVERQLDFVVGTGNRYPQIGSRLQRIAADYIDLLASRRLDERQEKHAIKVAMAIAEQGERLIDAHEKLDINQHGKVSRAAIAHAIGYNLKNCGDHPVIVAAIDKVVAQVGLKEGLTRRPLVKTDEDAKVIAFCRDILRRGYGAQRAHHCSDQLSKEGICEELGFAPELLTSNHLKRIREASNAAARLNPAVFQPVGDTKVLLLGDRDDLIQTGLADPIFDQGLPGLPGAEFGIDFVAVSNVIGVSPFYLTRSTAGRSLLDAKLLQVGIETHPGDRAGITLAELRAYGRGRRRKQADEADRTVEPEAIAARSARALERFARNRGLDLTTPVGRHLIETQEKDFPELEMWRLFHAELAINRAKGPLDLPFGGDLWVRPRMSLGSALSLLCAAKGMSRTALGAATGTGGQTRLWVEGVAHPSMADEEALDAINRFFGLPDKFLSELVNEDWRTFGRSSDFGAMPSRLRCHLTQSYGSLDDVEQRRARARALRYSCQRTNYARRSRVRTFDVYALRYEKWPDHLKAEWAAFEDRRLRSDIRPVGELDIWDMLEPEFANAENPVGGGTRDREKRTFEKFFGFLTLPVEPAEGPLLPPNALVGFREAMLAEAEATGYFRKGGLGIPIDKLTMGAVNILPFVRAFNAYSRHRSFGYSSETILEIRHFLALFKPTSRLRESADIGKRTTGLIDWWRTTGSKKDTEYPRETARVKDTSPSWDTSYAAFTTLIDELTRFRRQSRGPERLKLPADLRVEQKRNPFLSIAVILGSKTPAALYRCAIQDMIRNLPLRTGRRHFHVRDCLMVMILFQTYLRIKNVAQLTYLENNKGQLRKIGSHWYVKIHRDRFKNGGGAYFKNNSFFLMRLRDEDGLYSMIDWYLKTSRDYIRALKLRPKKNAGEGAAGVGGSIGEELELVGILDEQLVDDDAGADDESDEEVALLTEDDDEESDGFEDNDPDGEPDEIRFFIQPGGRQWLPSRLAGRFKLVSGRYLAESPDRKRGMKGLMVHGPHAIRHVGATDALSLHGSWEEAARVVQDAVSTVMQTYAHWAPQNLGEMAGNTMAKGRSRKPEFPTGVFMLSKPMRLAA